MIYGSVCSGIEAATMAWHGLGWKPAFFSEIDAFPSSVLAHHYPDVPNHGDMTKFQEWPDHAIDLLVGGTPCQSFSVAGLRAGLADPRGNLALVYLALAAKYQPRWVLWENVPGVLSSAGGRDFGAFLGGLGQLGYGFAYRVLDAQFTRARDFPHAVPQRRRRVFVVGHLGDWRPAAAVLFDAQSLRGDHPPSRQARQITAGTLSSRTTGGGGLGTDFELGGGLIPSTGEVAHCLNAGGMGRQDYETETMVAQVAPTLRAGGNQSGGDRPPGTDVDTVESLIPQPFSFAQNSRDEVRLFGGDGSIVGALAAEPGMKQTSYVAIPHAVAYRTAGDGAVYEEGDKVAALTTGTDPSANIVGAFFAGQGAKAGGIAYDEAVSPTLKASDSGTNRTPSAHIGMAVRRLTPRECERLQGFPDDFTLVPHRGKPAADGPRYKALGNSMAVNVMQFLGERIQLVEDRLAELRQGEAA